MNTKKYLEKRREILKNMVELDKFLTADKQSMARPAKYKDIYAGNVVFLHHKLDDGNSILTGVIVEDTHERIEKKNAQGEIEVLVSFDYNFGYESVEMCNTNGGSFDFAKVNEDGDISSVMIAE